MTGCKHQSEKAQVMNLCQKGKRAEDLAARYLLSRGYRIWKINWRSGHRELDLIALTGGELVVVEVKAREKNAVNDPWRVVNGAKQRNIILAAEAFIRRYRWKGPTRFDVIAVVYGNGGVEMEHIAGAFVPGAE